MTVATVADDLGVSRRTVLRWIERGDLPAVRLPGGLLRIDSKTLAASLQAWETCRIVSTDASGPATLTRPGPGTGG
jgi:excisionase family DNA binding protein